MKYILPIILFSGLFLYACASVAPVPEEPVAVVQEPAQEPQPEVPSEPVVDVPDTDNSAYTVSRELYEQTFEEIEALILELNSVISKKQFERWLTYLSTDYIRTYNAADVLNEINQYPQLKDNGVVLKDLKDYFQWVVVPSRSRATLGEIVFVGETQVIAYSSFDGKKAKLYELERIDDVWKITVW